MELNKLGYGSGDLRDEQVDSGAGPVRRSSLFVAIISGVTIFASALSVLVRSNNGVKGATTLYSDIVSYGSSNSFIWQTYKVTVPVIAGTGNDTVLFVNEYIAPYEGWNDLGCGGAKYWAAALSQQLHFVDSTELDRGSMPLVEWVEM